MVKLGKFLLYRNEHLWLVYVVRKDEKKQAVLHVTHSDKNGGPNPIIVLYYFFMLLYICTYFFKQNFAKEHYSLGRCICQCNCITGMWLMTKKKVESWYWWIATNIVSIPLYFVKHYVFTSVYYFVLLIMAYLD